MIKGLHIWTMCSLFGAFAIFHFWRTYAIINLYAFVQIPPLI